MVTLELSVTLPDDIAQDAEAFGLLRPEVIQQLICHEVERARTPVWDAPVLSEAQIEAATARGHFAPRRNSG